jgi:hypothetical protein
MPGLHENGRRITVSQSGHDEAFSRGFCEMPRTRRKTSINSEESIMRDARTGLPVREIRLLVPDARHPEVQARIKAAHHAPNAEREQDDIAFIEAISDYGAEGLLEDE